MNTYTNGEMVMLCFTNFVHTRTYEQLLAFANSIKVEEVQSGEMSKYELEEFLIGSDYAYDLYGSYAFEGEPHHTLPDDVLEGIGLTYGELV